VKVHKATEKQSREDPIVWNHITVGIMMILFGAFEITVAPRILERVWGEGTLPHRAYLFRSVRTSGWALIIVGTAFLLGLFGSGG
jgi:hypothetical protein